MEGKTKKARTEAARQQIAEYTQKVSSGTTIAHEDDKRADAIPTATQLKSLAEKLAAISGQ